MERFFYFYNMSKLSFLNRLANELLKTTSHNALDLIIILPNKRAKVFLLEEIKKTVSNNIFAPNIISIEEFVQDIAGIRTVDNIELLFEFYEVYLSITEISQQDSFESFANWAKILMQDFNEIDRYLLEADAILNYLEDIKEIEHWSVDVDKRTDLIDKHLIFWKKLPQYYHAFYEYLIKKGVGYQGLIYREAVANLNYFSENTKSTYIFAGFNALNKAEEKIIQHLLATDQAKVYWDIDETLLNDPMHDAGYFQRKFKSDWIYYKSNPYEWISNEFKSEKDIHVIATSKSIGQAKIAGSIINELASNNSLSNTALILGDENLLLPMLYSLPTNVEEFNITMGFSSKNNPAQLLITKLFKLHTKALARNSSSYVMYFKDVLDILTHPLIEPYINADELVFLINKNNHTFLTQKKLIELYAHDNDLFDMLFCKWDSSSSLVIENIAQILLKIKDNLSNEVEEDKIANAFVFSIFKVINKMTSYFYGRDITFDLKTLQAIYKQVIEMAEVSFEGEPLSGLQIMGVLESRVLDFDTLIITSLNEGKFPAGKTNNSFIPYDVKLQYGLPTFKEKDAIYTYHFYHLLQRATKIYLIYNSDSQGFDSGEKSRFITQLKIEPQTKHNLTFQYYNPEVPAIARQNISVPKTQKVLTRLREISDKGFSPSSLTTYVRNPIQFYFQRVLHIYNTEEVEETIAVNTLGTIIHATLEELYKPFIGHILTIEDVKKCFLKIEDEILSQFKKVYKEGEIKTGRNLLAFEVGKRNIQNFLNTEIEAITNGDIIQIISLEKTYERLLTDKRLPHPVLIKGNVDRIELRNGKLRITDYKTGRVDKANVILKDWQGLTSDIKNDKIIQVLAYAYMCEDLANGKEMEAGIISFKNLKSGFLPFQLKTDQETISVISPKIMESYLDEIVLLLLEIFNQDISFEEKI